MNVGPFVGVEVFEPDAIKVMSIALDEVCRKFDLTNDNQAEREVLARRIIALARRGECDPVVLRDGVLRAVAVRARRGLGDSDGGWEHDSAQAPPGISSASRPAIESNRSTMGRG